MKKPSKVKSDRIIYSEDEEKKRQKMYQKKKIFILTTGQAQKTEIKPYFLKRKGGMTNHLKTIHIRSQ